MKIWLKGGLIGLIIGVVSMLFSMWTFWSSSIGLASFSKFLLKLDFLAYFICRGFCFYQSAIIYLITTPLSYFIIGSIIGFIIQKVKK